MANSDTLPQERLLSRREVAEHFNISRRWLEIAAVRGGGPPMIKIGRLVRYSVADLRSWIDAQRVQSTSDEASARVSRG